MQNLSETNILDKTNTKALSLKKLEGGKKFQLITEYTPAGDQPKAISFLKTEILNQKKNQVLLGVTGSGKTFTMAKIIEELNRPALILAPNKTLAAQLYGEMKNFFPNNAVEYFVSYYDYYTPEAYVPRSDTYIEKEASINEQIDRMRHSATRSLLERDDVIIVSSVSCIYGLGSVDSYSKMTLVFKKNESYEREKIIKGLVELQYKRNDQNFYRGTFRVRGENIEVFPSHYEDEAWRITIEDNKIVQIKSFDPLTGTDNKEINLIKLYGNSHYITPRPTVEKAIKEIYNFASHHQFNAPSSQANRTTKLQENMETTAKEVETTERPILQHSRLLPDTRDRNKAILHRRAIIEAVGMHLLPMEKLEEFELFSSS